MVRAGPTLAAPATVWVLATFAAPFGVVILLSLHQDADLFGPLFTAPSAAQFRAILTDSFYLRVILETLALGAAATLLAALLGYPVALWLARMPVRWRAIAFGVILIPLLTNVVVRSLGIVLLLAPDGLINQALGVLGLGPIRGMLYTHAAVALALAQAFMPFLVLALYDVLQGTAPRVREAAQGLGASSAVRFWTIDFPLSLPGLRAGVMIVFLVSSTAYVSASLLGGRKVWTTGMLVWEEALQNLNAPTASALALIMTACSIGFIAACGFAFARAMPWLAGRPAEARSLPACLVRALNLTAPALHGLLLAAALALLLLPLALVCIQGFNDVPQASVAGFRAFTWRWYEAVLFGGAYVDSFRLSVEIALVSAAVALALAMPAAFALARHSFGGLTVLAGIWNLPLSLPQVAIGVGVLRLLQLYTAVPTFLAIVAVHVVLILPFGIALLRPSVQQLDRAQEDAAATLGAGALYRFAFVIVPGLAPGLAATGIIAFLLSLGEVTVTNFITTARTITLPVRIYAEASFSLEPTVHVVSTLMIMVTIVALFALNRAVRLDRLYAR
jgi:putative spermidine/putrescine transport system permease protein